jgi:predicted esterase
MKGAYILALAILLAAGPTVAAQDETFSLYSPLATNAALVDRLLSPLAAEAGRRGLAANGRTLAEQPLDLAQERFTLYVPAKGPPKGYGLLVFISPSDEAKLPPGWASILDRYGLIFVAAQRSGNDQNVIGRRAPLALEAAWNVQQRYAIDAERVFVGGFSGGSRVALQLALAYPDLLRGAFLDAGSDPIAVAPAVLPARPLFELVQTRSRIAYVSGAEDTTAVAADVASLASLSRWCVFGGASRTTPGAGHQIADARALGQALELLTRPGAPDASRLAACRTRVDREVQVRLAQATALVAAGDRDKARKALLDLDGSVGALAMPELRDLADRCACGPP